MDEVRQKVEQRAKDVYYGKTLRKSFARYQEILEMPNLLEVQNYLTSLRMTDAVLSYAIRLCEASRSHPLVELGISPRGISALVKMSRAGAVLQERNYVVPEDVQRVFVDVCAHRLLLRPQARVDGVTAKDVLNEVLQKIKPPAAGER